MLTYQRPDDLRVALPALLHEVNSQPEAVVLIVDNDPEPGPAREIVEQFNRSVDGSTDGPIRYRHEPEPGISAARNAALAWARQQEQEVIVFIDDDEHPEGQWLQALLDCYRRYARPAAVAGPVQSVFDGELAQYLVDGRFFSRRNFRTGTLMPAAATNNLLLKLSTLDRLGLRFDPDFGITGGSDSLLTRTLVRHGERIVWCAEALVTDRVPASRMTRQWALQKQYRQGNTVSRVALAMSTPQQRPLQRAKLAGGGLGRLVVGTGMRVAGRALRKQGVEAGGHRLAVRGRGMAAGAVGAVYSEYARP